MNMCLKICDVNTSLSHTSIWPLNMSTALKLGLAKLHSADFMNLTSNYTVPSK